MVSLRGELGAARWSCPVAQLFLSEGLPSVAGGPADPGTWDRWFGELDAFTEGDGEAQARAKKAAALPPPLAALYREVRTLREGVAQARAVRADGPGCQRVP